MSRGGWRDALVRWCATQRVAVRSLFYRRQAAPAPHLAHPEGCAAALNTTLLSLGWNVSWNKSTEFSDKNTPHTVDLKARRRAGPGLGRSALRSLSKVVAQLTWLYESEVSLVDCRGTHT